MPKKSHSTYRIKTTDEGYCGDSYCTGHSTQFLVCACGWKMELRRGSDRENIHLKHRLDEMER